MSGIDGRAGRACSFGPSPIATPASSRGPDSCGVTDPFAGAVSGFITGTPLFPFLMGGGGVPVYFSSAAAICRVKVHRSPGSPPDDEPATVAATPATQAATSSTWPATIPVRRRPYARFGSSRRRPPPATLLVQAIGSGMLIRDLREARAVVRSSTDLTLIEPTAPLRWRWTKF